MPAALLVFSKANADYVDSGAAYYCDSKTNIFSIVSVNHAEAPEDRGTVKAPRGFHELTESRSVNCKLAGTRIAATFRVRPPQPKGMCGGLTKISIDALLVNGKKVFEHPELFNHYCFEDQALHSIQVSKKGKVVQVEICHAAWNLEVGYHDVRCERRSL